MPILKQAQKRKDVLRSGEIGRLLDSALSSYLAARLRCFIALAWLFGLRISEMLALKVGDVYIGKMATNKGEEIEVLFLRVHILKKTDETQTDKLTPTQVWVQADHPMVQYVTEWLGQQKGEWLFPGRTKDHIQVVTRKWETKGVKKEAVHKYPREGGHLSSARIRQQLMELGPVWPHLFRHSLATAMAERGATDSELKAWFHTVGNWADRYVEKSGIMTERWSRREF